MTKLDILEEASIAVIKMAFRRISPDHSAIACSWGKDSMAVLYLIRQIYPNIMVVFCNTGVEYPDTLAFRDRMLNEWNLNYIEALPEKGNTFWSISKKYGLPGIRLNGKVRVPKCCQLLKDEPGMNIYRKHNITQCFTGITAAESRNRWMLQRRCGDYYFAKTQDMWKCHPIMSWSESDVLEYHKSRNIPLNTLYIKFPGVRVGCMPCTSYISWPETMLKTSPKMYDYILHLKEEETIDKKIKLEKWDSMINTVKKSPSLIEMLRIARIKIEK